MKEKKRTMLALTILMAFIAAVMFLPGLISAGDLDPSAGPAPTMKTLDEIPATWSQILPASERFELVLGGAGVLDKETGLVWEQSPQNVNYQWTSAIFHCIPLEVGGRKGWNLPTIEQLASLVDTSNSNPALPTGHPFDTDCTSGGCVRSSSDYWSATTEASNTTVAQDVAFNIGHVSVTNKAAYRYAWCVRGGQNHDAY